MTPSTLDVFSAPKFLTIEAVAKLCATSPRQIRNMQARGQIPAPTRIPGLGLRWSVEALTQWFAEKGSGVPTSTVDDEEEIIPEMSPQIRKYYDLYMQGETPAEIARLLDRSVGTVLAGLQGLAVSRGLKSYRLLRRGLPPVRNVLLPSPTTPAPEVRPEPPKPIAVSVNPRGEVVAVQSAPLPVTSPMVATPGDYAKAAKPLTPTTSTKIDPVSKDILVITTERIAFGTPAWCERMAALHVKKT